MTQKEIELKYNQLCKTPSDINQHLPVLREYADKCKHVTEMGTRSCVSLYAFLSSMAKEVIAYDIADIEVPEVKKLKFICADVLETSIEPTDFLFIDTLHTYTQLKQELSLHAKKVRKYIGFHDTEFFGINGENGDKGLMFAINEFLEENENWSICFQTDINNGLTIIERKNGY